MARSKLCRGLRFRGPAHNLTGLPRGTSCGSIDRRLSLTMTSSGTDDGTASPSHSCLSLGSSDMSSGELSTDSDCSTRHGEVFCHTGKAWVQKPRPRPVDRRSQRMRLRAREEAAGRQLEGIRQRCSLLRQRLATGAVRRQELHTQVEETSAMWAATTRANQQLAAGIAVLRAQLAARAAVNAQHVAVTLNHEEAAVMQGIQPSPFEQPAGILTEDASMDPK